MATKKKTTSRTTKAAKARPKKTAKAKPTTKAKSRPPKPRAKAAVEVEAVATPADPEVLEAEVEDNDLSEDFDEKLEQGVTALAPTSAVSLERANLLQRYLLEVRRHPLLTREEEYELAVRYQEDGDLDAARQLVTSNLRLVVKIALDYYRHWMDLLDLIQEGNVGLMQAVKKFDPYRGIRLSTYSSFWIRAYMLKFLMDNWRLVKIGTTQAQRKLFFNLKKERDRLEQSGFTPGAKMLANSLDVKESEVIEMDQRLAGRDESFDTPISEDGKQTREMVLADEAQPVDEILAEDQFHRIVHRKLEAFRQTLQGEDMEKEAFIYDHRLLSDQPMTLQEVGEQFGISRERVRQLESRLVQRIRDYIKAELPDYEDYEFVLQ